MKAPMLAPTIAFAAILTTGQALVTANGLSAMPLGRVADLTAIDPSPSIVLEVQGAERLHRLWQHRSILEQALRAPPEALPEAPPVLPRARPLAVPAPQSELSPIPQVSEAAKFPDQRAEASDDVVNCEEAATIVADYGFSEVRPIACSGDVYRFSATRDGAGYSVGIAAAAGEIAEVRRE